MTLSFPDVDMPITVEAAFGADPDADPASWSFTALTTLLADATITKREGREPGAKETDAKSCSFALLNSNGDLTPLYAASPRYPNITLDLPMRIKLNPTGTPTEWAAGWATSWQPDFLAGTDGVKTSIVRIELSGIIQRLSQGDKPLRSALFRTMAGVAEDDYQPYVYLPMEDGSAATSFASGLPGGTPGTTSGAINFAAFSELVGSEPLPTFAATAQVAMAIPSYTDTQQWVTQFVINVPSAPASATTIGQWFTPGGTVATWRVTLEPGSPDALFVRAFNAAGTEVYNISTGVDSGDLGSEGDFYGHTFMLSVANYQTGANNQTWLKGKRDDGLNIENATIITAATTAALAGTATLISPTADTMFGHWAFYTDPNFDIVFAGSAADINAAAMDGYAGETAGRRVERLCREERVLLYTTGDLDDTTTMGPQTTETLLVNLRECETVGGILGEQGFGLHYITQSARYNRPVDLTIDLDTYRTTAGSEDQVVRPAYDNKLFRNQWTVDRPNGSTATVRVGTKQIYEDSVTANVETDDQVPDQASWRAYRDSVDTLRWPGTPIDLAANPSLITNWLTVVPGLGRVKRTNLPDGHPPDAIDQMVDGFSETLTRRSWTVSYDGSPAFVYDVAELDDDDSGKLDTDGSDLTAAVSTSATSLSVATQTGTSPLWTTSAGEMPIPLLVAGEVMSATAIAAPTTITYGAVGTATHASNASVAPGIPASVAAGNLLIVLAAIRNSGTGVPDTPSGYTRLPVFAAGDNVQVFAKVAVGGDVAPTITFTGGVANATTSAQMIRIAGAFSDPAECFVVGNNQLNASAQNIGYPQLALTAPQLDTSVDNCIVIYVGWKQDDWTSVATLAGATEIAEASTTTGDDQGLVWDYVIQTTATDIAAGGSFTVTGGASAISRGAVFAIRSNVQTFTVTRSVNSVVKAHAAGTAVNVYRPARLAL